MPIDQLWGWNCIIINILVNGWSFISKVNCRSLIPFASKAGASEPRVRSDYGSRFAESSKSNNDEVSVFGPSELFKRSCQSAAVPWFYTGICVAPSSKNIILQVGNYLPYNFAYTTGLGMGSSVWFNSFEMIVLIS